MTVFSNFGKYGIVGGGGGAAGDSVQIMSDPGSSNMRTADGDGIWNLNPSGEGGGGQGVSFVGNELIFKGTGNAGGHMPRDDRAAGVRGDIIVFKALKTMPVSIEMWGGGGMYAPSQAVVPPASQTPGGMGGGGGYIKGNLTLQADSYYKLRVAGGYDYSGLFLTTADTDVANVERAKDVIIAVAGGGGSAGMQAPSPPTSQPNGGYGGSAGYPTGRTGGAGRNHDSNATGGTQSAGGTSASYGQPVTNNGQFLGGENCGGAGDTYARCGAGGYYSGGHNSKRNPGPGGTPGTGGGSNHSNSSFGNWVIVTNQGGQPTTARNVMPSNDSRFRSFSPGDPAPGSQWLDSYGGWSGGSPFSPAPSPNWTLYANTGQPEWNGSTSPPSEARGGWGMGAHQTTSTTAKRIQLTKGAVYITLNES